MKVSTYKPKSNIIGSFSVKQDDETDYIRFREILGKSRLSVGDYLVATYRELGKGSSGDAWIKALRFTR